MSIYDLIFGTDEEIIGRINRLMINEQTTVGEVNFYLAKELSKLGVSVHEVRLKQSPDSDELLVVRKK